MTKASLPVCARIFRRQILAEIAVWFHLIGLVRHALAFAGVSKQQHREQLRRCRALAFETAAKPGDLGNGDDLAVVAQAVPAEDALHHAYLFRMRNRIRSSSVPSRYFLPAGHT